MCFNYVSAHNNSCILIKQQINHQKTRDIKGIYYPIVKFLYVIFNF